MSNKIAGIEHAVMKLKPFTSGLASGFGINKLFSKGIAKRVVGKADLGKGLKWREKRKLDQIVHGDDVYAAQKELERGVKNVYERDQLPNFVYQGFGDHIKFPKRLKGGIVNVSKKDKLLYNIGKYGPTATAIKAPIAVGAGVAINSSRPQRPAQLPDDVSGWKSLDKKASDTYINSKENIMIKNPNFQIAFSDELHKIATAESHPEAVEFLKEASKFTGIASKAWRSLKRFGKNPVLKTKEKGYQALEGVQNFRAKYSPFQTGRMKARVGASNAAEAASFQGTRIVKKRENKIREIAERAGGTRGEQAYKQKKVLEADRKKYQPSVEGRQVHDRWVRSKNLRAQRNIKDKNILKAKVDEKKLEIANIEAGIAKDKNKSIVTRIGGGITSKDAPGSVKTLVGGGALAVGGATAYNLTMAEKKKKDNSIFKFGGKVSE